MKRCLTLAIVFALSLTLLASEPCKRAHGWLGRIEEPLSVTLVNAGKVFFYPLVFPIRVVAAGKKSIWKAPFKVVLEDGLHLLGYLFLFGAGSSTTISMIEIEDGSKEFDRMSDGDIVVFVDGIPEKNRVSGMGKYIFDSRYGNGKRKKAFYLRPNDPGQLRAELQDISRKHGPIARLDVLGHGAPGSIDIGKEKLDANEASKNPLTGVFTAGAMIRLRGCQVGNGTKGEAFLSALSRSFLDRGGTVFASKSYMLPDVTDDLARVAGASSPPPDWVRRAELPLTVFYRAAVGIYYELTSPPLEEPLVFRNPIRSVQTAPKD